jgi:hypothetical protein
MGKIANITKEEFNKYLKSIGGLENGYGERYWGKNIIRKWLFNITAWVLHKLPHFERTETFWKVSKLRMFIHKISYWLFKPILKDTKPKNPFRSMIYDCKWFSVGSGWYGLIKTLIEESIANGWNKEVCQVKEKFGGLRFYINGATREVHDIMSKYESMSYEICEECGEPGEERPGGWIRTLCDKHYDLIKKSDISMK